MAEAKARNVPILLSIGYAACHWCHVMAHESFENSETAALMNERFVNVKVDREERPDIDTIYQSALALMGEQGGWPLTMFLTPEGEPFWGGTYFPPTSRYGRPGFRDLLREISRLYANEKSKITESKTRLLGALKKMGEGRAPDSEVLPLDLDLVDVAARRATRDSDPFFGGLGSAPKFPQPFVYELIWRAHLRQPSKPFFDAVTTTLDHICQGGIYDHLAGGFARYSTDERWLVPHFEKMLYDNAQLVDLLSLVHARSNHPLYAERVRETIGFLETEMLLPEGAFAASHDADSEGVEGKYYVWSRREIDVILTDHAERFARIYDVTEEGNWEGHSILNRLDHPALLGPDEEADLKSSRALLLAARRRRVKPGFDDKILADWNGLAIIALTRAALVLKESAWLDLARRAFQFISEAMSDGERLRHSWRAGRKGAMGLLEDYANMSRAALMLHAATGAPNYLEAARRWTAVLERHFWDKKSGGYFMTPDDASDVLLRTRNAMDNAVPSGNGTMASVLTELFHLTGEGSYRQRAEALVQSFIPEIARASYHLASLLNGLESLAAPLTLTILAVDQDPEGEAMARAALAHGWPGLILDRRAPGAILPSYHPAYGKTAIGGKATAYLCRGHSCSAPVTALKELDTLLS